MNIVEKYGGTSVGTIEQIQAIALHAKHMKEQGHNLVIVASAMGKTTNKLIELAHSVTNNPNKRELDSLLSTGEQQTITLLAIAMNSIGVDAISLTGYQAGFLTSKHHSRALIKDIDTTTIQSHLDQGKVVVVAGFQGATEYGDITTLGRGGSDTTAVAIAAKLGYQCHIFTDVNGVYTTQTKISFTAVGAGMDNNSPKKGDTRYVPQSWTVINTNVWNAAPYTASFGLAQSGDYTLKVAFAQQQYDGSSWKATGTMDTRQVSFSIAKAKVTASGTNLTPAANRKSSVKTGDNTPILPFVCILIIAAGAIGGVVFYKKKNKK